MSDVVRLVIGERRFKLRYRQRDLRDVSERTNKTVLNLLGDKFAGWPYLILYARRFEDPKMTLDNASNLMDEFVADGNDYDQIGLLLMDAIEASGFIKFEREAPSDGDTVSAVSVEGKATGPETE